MPLCDTASLICFEFADKILQDHERDTILVVVKDAWYVHLLEKMKESGFELMFKSTKGKKHTCVFDLNGFEYVENWDDDD